MSEITLQILALAKLLSAVIFAGLYALGGMAGISKGARRFGGVIWIGLAISIISFWQRTFSAMYLLYPLLLLGALHLGYGAEKVLEKLRRRAIYGLALGVASLPIALKTGNWIMFASNMVLCVGASITFGVFNPLRNARDEETIIGALSIVLPMFMV